MITSMYHLVADCFMSVRSTDLVAFPWCVCISYWFNLELVGVL